MGKTSLTLQWTSNTSHSIISMSWDHGFLHSVKDYSSINSLINLAVFTRNFHQQIPKKERRRRKLFSFKQSRIHNWDWRSCRWNWPFFKAHHSVYFLLLARNRSNVLSIFARRLHFLYLVTELLVWKVPTLYKNNCRLRKKHGGQRSVFPDALFLYSNYLTFGIDICSYRW